MEYERYLEDNIFELHNELFNQTYKHNFYTNFNIFDPKYRIIHKATVKDRLAHHIVFKELYNIFDSSFIYHSYSSRNKKGTHLAVKNLAKALRKSSKNYIQNTFVLKCDIRKFFHSISHKKLFEIIKNKIDDEKFLWLIWQIIDSFSFENEDNFLEKRGLPIGNLTSQIFANIFLDKFDWFLKKELKIKYYFRYADDFVIIDQSQDNLKNHLNLIEKFLDKNLNLKLHERKIEIRKFSQGIDFLGYIILPHYIKLRTKTKKRMIKKIKLNKIKLEMGLITDYSFNQSIQSYYGMLRYCNSYKIKKEINNLI